MLNLREIDSLMARVRPQVFPPANAIFAGIGVLLQVSFLSLTSVPLSQIPLTRPSKMSALARMLLETCLAAWSSFSSDSKNIFMSDRQRL